MIQIKNLCVSYGKKVVYQNFNLNVQAGGVTCILGESGCGKTTLLNAVAGLIKYGGEITPQKVSYVFQSPRLIPNLTVLKNLTFIGASEEQALAVLEKVGVSSLAHAYPSSLSGGEAQRVSVARALLHPAELLLCDEPFSSLDLKTKLSVMDCYKKVIEDYNLTSLLVTHDIDEALYLADRIVVIKEGAIAGDLPNSAGGSFGAATSLREDIIKLLTQ